MSNKKMIFTIGSTMIIASLLLTGCFGGKDKEISEGIETPEIIEEEVEDEIIEEVVISNGGSTGLSKRDNDVYSYSISTTGGFVIQTGMPYTIEKLNESNEWEMLDLELMFTMQIIIIDSENPLTQDIDVSSLEVGKYRVYKDLMDGDGEPIERLGTIEFDILEEEK